MDTNLQKQRELQKANQEQYAEGKMRGAAPGKKTAGLQQKNLDVKTKKNKQKTPGNGDGGSTIMELLWEMDEMMNPHLLEWWLAHRKAS